MAKKLIHNRPKRIFTFGCSFTKFFWGTYPNIIGKEFPEAEFRNFGHSGAGNQYIHNMLMQVDAIYKFNQNDLVVVQWTNVMREDRYNQGGWLLTGNIVGNPYYGDEWLKKYFSEFGAYLRDLALIRSAHQVLKDRTNLHMLKMLDMENPSQYEQRHFNEFNDFYEIYHESIKEILPSFYQVLWNNDLQFKTKKDRQLVHPLYSDGHPSPQEHYEYLKSVFDHNWTANTDRTVSEAQDKWLHILKQFCESYRPEQNEICPYMADKGVIDQLNSCTFMSSPQSPIDPRILRIR